MKTTASRASAVSQTRGFGDLLYDKAGARPSLDLDFAGTSSLRDKITGEHLIQKTNSTKATYVGNDGLIKTTRINLERNSNAPSYYPGYGNNTVEAISNEVAPPLPEMSNVIKTTFTTNTYKLRLANGSNVSGNHTFSVFVKKGTQDKIRMSALYQGSFEWTFSTKTINILGTYPNTYGINIVSNGYEELHDGWYRLKLTYNMSTSNPRNLSSGYGADADMLGFTYYAGFQWEEGTEATDFIPTYGSSNSEPRFTHERVETGNLLHGTNRYLKDWAISATSALEPYAALAPDGTYSALKYVNNTGTYNTIYRHENYVSGVKTGKTYTLSAYVKTTGNSSHFKLWTFYGGTYLSDTGKMATPTDWTRYEVTFTATADKVRIGFDNSASGNVSGSWNTEFLFWGVQLNEGSTADTYVSSIDTFTSRLTNATFVDSAGLLKTSAVNKIHHSNFINSWARDAGLSPSNHRNDVVNPFGETEVQKVLELSMSNTSGQSVWYQTGVGKSTGVLSVYAKANTFNNLNFGGQTPNQSISFNLSNGTINSSAGTTGAIENVGNGWYRCSVNIHTQTDWLIFQPHQDGATRVGARMQIVGPGSIFIYGAMFESPASQPSDFIENLTASTASFPRYSHDPETLTPTGLYLEPAVTNLAAHSNNFSTWTKHSTTTITLANTETLSPDGLYNAWKWTGPANQNYPSIYKTHSTNNLNPHTFSLFAKAGTLDKLGLEIRGTGSVPQAFFDLTNGTVQSGTGQIKKYPNGWYRCSVTITTDSSEVLIIRGGDGANQPGTIYIFGVQLEVGRFATSYIPTDTSTVTKAADVYTSTANLTETFEPKGLLIEEARTNILHYSSNPVTNWDQQGGSTTVTANYATAPDGTNTAVRIQMPNVGGTYFRDTTAFSSGTTYTTSFWGKSNGQSTIQLLAGPGASLNVTLSDRWERYTHTFTANGSTSSVGFDNGSNVVDALIWGIQVEAGSFVTSYIPTDSNSAVTRTADVASISGDNFGTYRTNLQVRSEHLWDDNSWGIYNSGTTSNESITKVLTPYAYPNPIDGRYNAALIHRSSNDYQYIFSGFSAPRTTGQTIYVKPVSNPCVVQLFTQRGDSGRANFDLINKTHGGDGTRNITEVGNGWLRLEWLATTAAANPSSVHVHLAADDLTTARAAGTGTNVKFYAYAPQIEDNSVTNYIPSTDTFVSRLGKATYVDSNGLIKTAYRNELGFSEDLNSWNIHQASISSQRFTAPDGTETAFKLVPDAVTTNISFVFEEVTANVPGTLSVFVKSDEFSHVNLVSWKNDSVNIKGVSFDLNNRTIHDSHNATGEIIDAGNGWSKIILRHTDSSYAPQYFLIQAHNGQTPNKNDLFRSSLTYNGTDGLLIWHPMKTDSLTDAGEYAPTTSLTKTGGPRYSHDPETLIPTGLYLEPAMTNYWHYSNLFTFNGFGAVNGMYMYNLNSTENAATAPDGTLTAASVIPKGNLSGGNNYWMQQQHTQGTAGSTFSCFIKYNGWRYVAIRNGHNSAPNDKGALFDILNGTLVHTMGGSTANIEAYPNGWYRISCSNPDAGNGWASIVFRQDDTFSYGAPQYTTPNDGVSGIYLWGIQWEPNSYPTSVIIASGNDTTRAADVYTSTATTVLDRDGGNKESWYGHRNSSIYLEAGEPKTSTPYNPGTHHTWLNINDNTANSSSGPRNGFWLHISRYQSTGYQPQFDIRGGNSTTSVQNVTPSGKFAVRYDDNIPSVLMAANGLSNTSSTHTFTLSSNGTQMFYNNMFIGYNFTWNQYRGYANTTFNRLTVWNKSIDDQQLINITT